MRDQLPALRGVAYLNAGTNGPVPRAAARAMEEELHAQSEQARIGRDAFERMGAVRDRARAAAARVVGAPPEQVALTGSTSEGIGLVCAGLAWSPGDEVVTTTEEHPGLLGPLDSLRRRHGVAIRRVEAGEVASAVDSRTRLVAVSHVLWTTGRVLGLPRIAESARAAGALLVVDGAQGAGNIAVDAPASGADFYAFSGQKWLLGPMGCGGLWVHPRAWPQLEPVLPGYLTYRDGHVGDLRDDATRYDPGTIDPVTLAGLAAAIEWVEGLPGGRDAFLQAARRATAAARDRLAGVPGVELVDPGGPSSGLLALRLAARDPAVVTAELLERGVLVRSIPGTQLLRVSVGAWTDEEDIERLAAGLSAPG